GEVIFWLNGMAGTGKSTISRTVAQSFADRGLLGASFFFKRGERGRGNAALLFTTIATQLVAKEPDLAPYVRAAIEDDPSVTSKALREQFEKLILKPLGNLKGGLGGIKEVVLVIDALDECERDNDIRVIIYLLSQAKALSSVSLKSFLTSRPELPVRLGFSDIEGKYQDLVLHEIPKPIIEHDIATFLDFELARIRHDYNAVSPADRQLPPEWPGCHVVQALVDMAVPLFIFAATMCRFIRESGYDPRQQLTHVLQYQSRTDQSEIDRLDATYRPVLDRLLVGSEAAKRSAIARFRAVVGSIVLLAEPLSIRSLARLLDVPEDNVFHQLQPLHSVLSVPTSTKSPVRTFHLSFRDFLVDRQENYPFCIDERQTHERLAIRCLELLSTGDRLKKDVCGLRLPGTRRSEVNQDIIDTSLPPDMQYAFDLDWDACMQTLEGHTDSVTSVAFSHDSKTLASASDDRTIKLWDAATGSCTATLEGHTGPVYSVAFSHDSKTLASASDDRTIKLWDAATGNCTATLEGHTDLVTSVAFSHDSKTLASASDDRTIKLWDAATGGCPATLGCTATLKIGRAVTHLVFDKTGSSLLTDIGTFTLNKLSLLPTASTATPALEVSKARSDSLPQHVNRWGIGLSEDNAWITWDSYNVLWLPQTYRPTKSGIAEGRKLAIGCPSGRVLVLAFSQDTTLERLFWLCRV
ncbi:hypothetical protein C8A05DRAFT_15350, partial [Staphylotrichum tortipilum]